MGRLLFTQAKPCRVSIWPVLNFVLAAISLLCLALADPPKSGAGYVLDAKSPTLLVVLYYKGREEERLVADYKAGKKVQLPTFRLRIAGLIEPPRGSRVYREATQFSRDTWMVPKQGFSLRQVFDPAQSTLQPVEFELQGRNAKGEWLGEASYWRSEPSVDFQYRSWQEPLSESLLQNGYARLGDLSGIDAITKARWGKLEAQARLDRKGLWAFTSKS